MRHRTWRRAVKGKIIDSGPTSPISSRKKYSMDWQMLLLTVRVMLRASSAAACMAGIDGGNSPRGEDPSGAAEAELSVEPGVDDDAYGEVPEADDCDGAGEAGSDQLLANTAAAVSGSMPAFGARGALGM